MAEMTLEEAQNKIFDVDKLSDAEILRMNKLLQAESSKEGATEDDKTATDIVATEMQTRLEAYSKLDSFELGDLDNVIAMAGAVSSFSAQADMAKEVLAKAQAQKASLTPEQLNEAALEAMMKDPSYSKEDLDVALDAGVAYEQEILKNREQEATQQQTAENVQPESQTASNETEDKVEDTTAEENKDDKEEEVTPTPQEEEALEAVENTPEDQAELNKFDKEAGIDKVTQEQLEKNDQIMDNMPHPLALDANGNLVNKEFADEVTALKNLTITDDNGKDLSEEEQNSARSDLIYAAQLEAETYARAAGNGNPEDVQKLYYSHFKEALQRNVVAAAYATDFKKGMTKEQISEKFAQTVNNPQKASRSAVRAVTANSSAGATKLKDRIKAKFKSIPAVQKMEAKINAFDAAMTEKYGKKYLTAKRYANAAWKSVKNVAIYTAIGSMSGPAAPFAMAAFAVKSAYDSTKSLQEEAKKNNMSFWQYAKANKGKVALSFTMSGLAMAGAALGMGAGGQELAVRLQPALRTASRVLSVGSKAVPAMVNTVKAGWKRYVSKNTEGAKADWEKAKEGWSRTVEAAIGIAAGSALTAGIAEAKADTVDGVTGESPHVPTPDSQQMTPEEMSQTLAHMGLSPDAIAQMDPQAMQAYINMHPQDFEAAQEVMQDKDHDGISDVYDDDHGQGWATANETQLGRLMDADPAKVNALLGGTDYSSSQLREMMENGQFNDEQLKAIHGLASKEFDAEGHIIDADLKEYYENLAKEAAAKEAAAQEAAAQEEPQQMEDPLTNVKDQEPVYYQPEAPQMSPEEQRAYDEILKIISKGEDMNNPEVRASVEGLAKSHLQDILDARDRGDNLAIAEKITALHNQGEEQELAAATRENEDDGRRMRHAKEDVIEAKSKLDAAKEALAQDPNNEKLQKEVAKLEQKFDKESLDLEQREIKEARSDLKDQIKQDEKAFDNRNKAHETIEQNFGISEFDVNKKLAEMGVNVNNLPEDKSTLSQEAQDLLNIRDMYQQAHQNEADLQNRIQENEQLREDLKNLEKESKADEKAVKRGEGLSIEAEERLPGQSNVVNSELLHSVQDVLNPQQEAEQPQFAPVNEAENKGMENPPVYQPEERTVEASAEHQTEKVEEKVATQEAPAEEKTAEKTENSEIKEKEEKIRNAARIVGMRNGLDGEKLQEFIEHEVEIRTPHEQQPSQEPVAAEKPERHTIESKMGNVFYSIDENGGIKMEQYMNHYAGNSEDRITHAELSNDIQDHKYGENRNNFSRAQRMSSDLNADVAMGYKMVYDDIQARLANGENIPNADKAIQNMEKSLGRMGLKLDEKGELTAINNQSDTVAYKKLMESKSR